MRYLIVLILLTILGHASYAEIQIQSFYFKKNSEELTPDSHQKLTDFILTLDETKVQIVELGTYAQGMCSDSAKRLSDLRMVYILKALGMKNKSITINSWGNRRINVKFAPLNWDRVDIYCFVQQVDSLSENSTVQDEVPPQPTSTYEKKKNQPLILNILFEGGTSKMIEETLSSLDVLHDTLIKNPLLHVHIRGHVCCDNNKRISRKRAKSVYNFLIDRGISESRLSYRGYSNNLPLVYPEKNANDRRLNRRVDVIFSLEKTEGR